MTTIVSRKALPDIARAAGMAGLREELNYVLYEDGHFVATDGHIMIRYPFEFEKGTDLPERFAIHRRHFMGLSSRSPVTKPITIQYDGKYLTRSVAGDLFAIAPIVTDIKYPNYKKALDKSTEQEQEAISQIGLNPYLLARAMKLLRGLVGSCHVKMVFAGPEKPVEVKPMDNSETSFKMIIMPVLIRD